MIFNALLGVALLTSHVMSTSIPGMVTLNMTGSYIDDYKIFNSTQDNTTYINASLAYLADGTSVDVNSYLIKRPPTIAGVEVEVLDAGNYNLTGNYNNSLPEYANRLRASYTIQKTYASSNADEIFRLWIYVENLDQENVTDVEVEIFLNSGLRAQNLGMSGILANNSYISYGTSYLSWSVGNMTGNSSTNGSFLAQVNSDTMGNGLNYYFCAVTWSNTTDKNSTWTMTVNLCIDATITYEQSLFYKQGYTALSFFMAFILGILLVVLGFFIYHMIRRKKSISPSKANQEKVLMERGKAIMMDENDALKRTGHTINEYSVIGEGDSIVGLLGMKDKMQMHREIDSLDILNTVIIDTSLEKERNDASMATTELLIGGLHANNDITKATMDTAVNNLRSRRTHMDRQQDEDYKREMNKLYKKISAKNRAMMNSLIQKQRDEKKELVSNTQDLPPKEQEDLIRLMNEQQQSELNAETYRLKLEQDEETEKLRKEFAIRSRMGIKELQLQALQDVKDQGKLSDQQIKWLLAEHQKNQKALEGMYDDEISRQRMNLEEKLARRKALAQAAETQEDDNDDLLNTVAGHQIGAIEAMKKAKAISAADANVLIDQAKAEMITIKDKMEKDRANQESALHKRLSDLKKKRLSDLEKEHEAEIREYDRKCAEMQTEGPIDPVTYADGRLKLLSQQRVEKANLENEIDNENIEQLAKLRSEIATQTESDLRNVNTHLLEKLDGNDRAKVDQLLADHKREIEALRAAQARNRDKQLKKLQERLEESREQWNQRKEAEKEEQQQLREYEDNVVSKLVNSQVSMSDDERERILKEHEKQMVKLENSLTLNKLRQKRMIEEKIAQRRSAQMEKLQLKQHKEKETQRRQIENTDEDSGDEASQRKKLELMKEHVEQKMAVLQGRKMDWDTELESIRVEMLKERSLALKDQEERLGALVAQLQLSKAKELAKIEEQQRAIHNLKTNLIDDLNSRGVLSDPETQAVIKRHQEEQEVLNQRLEKQRQSQEMALREKLQMRLQQREKSMISMQDEELKNLAAPNKTAAKIKKMLLIHKHMVSMEKMRNQLEREISQTLEQVRHEYEVCKRKAVQDQEMEFIAGLVRVGTIPKEELESVLRTLYPGKSEEELKDILGKIFDPKLQTNQPPMDHAQATALLSRVMESQAHPPPFLRRQSSISNMGSSRTSITAREILVQEDSLRGSKRSAREPAFPTPSEQQQHYDRIEDNSRFRPSSRQFDDSPQFPHPAQRSLKSLNSSTGFRIEDRETYNNAPHPLEQGLGGSQRNGNAYGNRIMEEDDDDEVATAIYAGPDRRLPPSKLPPLAQSGRKKKKKNFLKKVAKNSPRLHDDDDEL
ncbi:trichohyalin-like isoform X1 [Dreissena polymorpha]|nr:trichohyalin-like isoform X1 [Dreissena polymorpha]XP_052251547.1 trichohyalin-like isoform X1 [Dreissena polymorpha]XP_052251548.1 trichohyalin-like isoform X1 [Dreissena polymorpha]XP_052251549.1 trichohyalin-like isoform X1 [Dreissena polymorpha]